MSNEYIGSYDCKLFASAVTRKRWEPAWRAILASDFETSIELCYRKTLRQFVDMGRFTRALPDSVGITSENLSRRLKGVRHLMRSKMILALTELLQVVEISVFLIESS